MIELIREQFDKVLGKQQWWDAGSRFKVLVSMDQDICSLHITDLDGRDVSEIIGNILNTELQNNYNITSGIDSYFIEIPSEDLMKILKEISVLNI